MPTFTKRLKVLDKKSRIFYGVCQIVITRFLFDDLIVIAEEQLELLVKVLLFLLKFS